MSEKVKNEPTPKEEVTEETPEKAKFPTTLVRNVIVGAIGVALTGYVVSKMRNKDDAEEESETPWMDFVPATAQQAVAGE